MLSVGLTGGIGSGKSTFGEYLRRLGAEIIDADGIGRAALAPGEPAWKGVVDQFGDEILEPGTMEISRGHLADIVFNDPAKLAALNAITHPRIVERIAETYEMLSDTNEIVILDAALLVGTGFEQLVELIIVVDAPEDLRRKRLHDERGLSYVDIDARMKSQPPPGVLLAKADIVVDNSGDEPHLEAEAERVWEELVARRDA